MAQVYQGNFFNNMDTRGTQESLMRCLSWCGLNELPEKYNGEGVWLQAIARVVKSDGGEYYVVMKKSNDAEDRIIKSFGPVASIVRIVELHPYLWLSKAFLPVFKSNTKKERLEYLAKTIPATDFSECTLKEMDKAILCLAIRKQRQEYTRKKQL